MGSGLKVGNGSLDAHLWIGNVGILTGPPFFATLAGYMNGTGKLAIQGVDYPADIAGFVAGGSSIGATTMYIPSSNEFPEN